MSYGSEMLMVALLKQFDTAPAVAQTIPIEMRMVLNRLRFHAARCRASAYLDIYRACSLIDPNCEDRERHHAELMLRVMDQALGHRPRFLRPGETDVSFDEHWLVAALNAARAGDEDSFAFLMRSRVSHTKRRIFSALVRGLAEAD